MYYLFNIFKRIKSFFVFVINYVIMSYFNVKISKTEIKKINGIPYIRNYGDLTISNDVEINSNYSSNPIGGQTFCTIFVRENAKFFIGQYTGVSNSTFVCWNEIYIGKNVYIGGDCKIYDTDFHSLNYDMRTSKYDNSIKTAPVIIKSGSFIGAGTIVLKGVTIGEKSIIGAGSVVTRDVPDNEIWAGNPVRFIRKNE